MKREEGNIKLHKASNILLIEDCIKDLNVEYFVRSQKNNNQLINQLINEYSELPNSSNPTIICRISSESAKHDTLKVIETGTYNWIMWPEIRSFISQALLFLFFIIKGKIKKKKKIIQYFKIF